MNKQEEIRKKLWELLDGFKGKPACDTVGIILTLLHSQGVVIKVDNKPIEGDYHYDDPTLNMAARGQKLVMLKAGYVAVEPLIKESQGQ